MTKIALVTDSSCDLSSDLLSKFNIEVVPLRIIYAQTEYRDQVDITPNEVYDRLDEEVPTTSMPSPQDILETFEKLADTGYSHCIVISLSSGLSGTYQAFQMIAQNFDRMKIDIIDSKGLSWILGFLVLEAAQMIQEQFDYHEILERIKRIRQKIKGFFIVDTLEYLKKGGRIGKVAATLGSMLNLKPIITTDDQGLFTPYQLARGKKQAIKKMVEPLLKQLESTKASIAIIQGRAEVEAEALRLRLKDLDRIGNLYVSPVSPALVVHTGPGLIGIVINPEHS
ncbi:DegV family protein [Kroppenstedtia pulmonis]|uniref:DegV family protein n=1 Tax=Kroppenstedtia pulmonis TaxID=1380685 RepID=A0A7D4BIU3_9BACL|nr:DegV family protein [Kroppenstedtia pulmonis]QKG83890.1 DegV family protein [Kroppenstedtia pulmonis]